MAGAQHPGRFRPGEIDATELTPGAESELLSTARELEWLAATEDVGPTAEFADRVMAVVSREPVPQPIAAALGAAGRRHPLAALGALGDVWRVAFTGGRPFAVRLPAIVLVALLVLGSLGFGAIGAGALAGLVGPAPSAAPAPSLLASPSPSPESPSPSPSPSPVQSESPQPRRTPDSTEAPTPSGTPESSEAPQPTDTPTPTETSGDDDGGHGGG